MPRLALNTENSPLVDAGEQDFFTSLWLRLFCRLSFFARNLNSGLFIRRTVCRSVHLCVFCLWRVCSYISKQKLTRLRGAQCSLAASVPDLYLFQWPQNFCSSLEANPLPDLHLYLSPHHTYMSPLWPFRKWAELATGHILSRLQCWSSAYSALPDWKSRAASLFF